MKLSKRPPKPIQQPQTATHSKQAKRKEQLGKENSHDQDRQPLSKSLIQKIDNLANQPQQKQTSKSHGGNKNTSQTVVVQRPATQLHQASKVISPQSDVKSSGVRQRFVNQSALNNTVKVGGACEQFHGQSIMSPGDDKTLFDQLCQKSTYSSTKGKHQDAAITGKRVMQPKLVVGQGNELLESSDRLGGFSRYSPNRPNTALKDSRRKISKKSKSQTIQATSSQNIKATGRNSKPRRFMEFFDASLQPTQSKEHDDEKEQTLKILNSSAADIGKKSAKSRQHSSADRSKVQMKYLNFHRKNVINQNPPKEKSQLKGRAATQIREIKNECINLNKTQSTSADRIQRFTGSISPRSKTGSAISRHNWKNELMVPAKNKSKVQGDQSQQAKSAVNIPGGISKIRLNSQTLHNESDLSVTAVQRKQQSIVQNDKSNFYLPQNQRSGKDLNQKHRTSISPERAFKIDRIIRDNIKKELQAQQGKLREIREREASSQRRRTLLQQKNQLIRRLNNEKVIRRKKLQENDDFKETSATKGLEEKLLAASDGANNGLDSQKNSLTRVQQTRDSGHSISLTGQYGRTQGMDFIDVRKEIMSRMKAIGSGKSVLKKKGLESSWLADGQLNLQTSKSNKQDFVPLRSHQVHQTSLSLAQQDNNNKVVGMGNLAQVKNGDLLTKRDKIRKFMKEKANMMRTKAVQQKSQEINTLKQVRCNLTRLNEFVQKQTSGFTTPALRVKRSHKKQHLDQDKRHERSTTPSRVGFFEQSDASINISAKLKERAVQKQHETLCEDSKLSSIDAQDASAKRKTSANKHVLSVCFEKSASQKALRKQIRNPHSPQILKHRQQSSKRPRSALSLQTRQRRKIKSVPRRIQTSGQQFIIPREGTQQNDEITMNLKFSDSAAAVIIQKEVRKYLGSLGFYEAKLENNKIKSPKLYSPDRHLADGSQIDIFMLPHSRHSNNFSPLHSQARPRSRSPPLSKSPAYELVDPIRNTQSQVQMQISPAQLDCIQKFKKRQVPKLLVNSTPLSQSEQHHDLLSQTSSVFERNSFQQFTQQRLQQLMQSNEYLKLIQFREECIAFREKKENKIIQTLLRENKMTPRAYLHRKEQIEKWVTLQRREIEQTKLGFKEEWDKTLQMIDETQKNVDFTKLKLQNGDSNSYSQASSHNNQSKPSRNILIDQAPSSYRSGRDALPVRISSDVDPSQSMQTSRESQKIDDQIAFQLQQKDHQNSRSEIKLPQSDLRLDKHQQAMTDEKSRIDQLQDSQHGHSSSGGDIDQMPSLAFLNKLEQAANNMMPRDSNNGTLTIEEHSYTDDFEANAQFNDGNFKNQVVKISDINQLFADGSHTNSDQALSEQKSEPLLHDLHNEHTFSTGIQQEDTKRNLNYEPEEAVLIPAVVSKVKDNNHRADKLTDQLIEQLLLECLVIPVRQKLKSQPPALPEQEVFSIESYSVEREEKKEWIEMRQRHLIEANLIRVDQYVNELVDVLLQFDISDISENSHFDYTIKPQDNFHIQFLKLLTQPIQRPALDTLELMQKSELGSYQHFETTLDASKYPIVSVELYLEIEKAREESMKARKETADARRLQIWESIHIYNKCIFDAVNESLMKFRPYGIVGNPMPWSNKVRRLQTKVEIASVDTERLFQMVKQEIFRWSQVFCGCLPGPVFNFPNPRTGVEEFQADLHREVRERKLTQVLTQDQVEQEHHWLNYEFEEVQVKVDLSDMILECLVTEIITFLNEE